MMLIRTESTIGMLLIITLQATNFSLKTSFEYKSVLFLLLVMFSVLTF